jgi:phosphatidylglycerol:prolipoprotein diacylglycerol transferase
MYLGWYGLGRVFIEGLRMDSLYVGSTNLRVSQLVAGLCFLCAAGFLIYDKIFREHDPEELYVNQVAQRAAAAAAEKASEEAEADLEEVEKSSEGAETDLEEETEENETPATEAPEASEEE